MHDGKWKSYELPNSKKSVNYWVIYRDYEETKLTLKTKKAELLVGHRIRGLKSNIDKWKFLNNGKSEACGMLSLDFQLSLEGEYAIFGFLLKWNMRVKDVSRNCNIKTQCRM
ncbi:hypothetical protein RhiirA4_422725 [Rhizophagus irregularis]|uniref:Uncharacterized protein n=1 Tax=Rhizophagus irregularis TaxID=588596 RepID=A0A2I1GR80_9GLOM|nr:hypothetical protein RhiirA4_422725 [Rhizophagus irregularis]